LGTSLEKLKSNIDIDIPNVDVFKASYFFLAYKSFLNKNDKNLELLNIEIEQLIFEDEQTAVFVLVMIGYTFSFELLYESLHSLNNAPLIKKSLLHSNPNIFAEKSTNEKGKTSKVKITKNTEWTKDDNKTSAVLEEPLNSENVYESDLNKYVDGEIPFEKEEENKNIDNNEKTKSVPELQYWIDNNTKISKSTAKEWKSFIEKYLIYGEHSLKDIIIKVEEAKLEKKLTIKMLTELEKFYVQ
jgi:hypothetical protein